MSPPRTRGRSPSRRDVGADEAADLLDPGRINVHERWESQAAVEAFRGSGPSDEQGAAVRDASVAEYDVTNVRSLTG